MLPTPFRGRDTPFHDAGLQNTGLQNTGLHDTPLRGRDDELAVLTAGLDRLAARRGSITVITGRPGSGKTRLLYEAQRCAQARGLDAVRVEPARESRYVPGAHLLRDLIDDHRRDELSARAESRYWLIEELSDAVQRRSLRRPLLITVDDLQWCDDLTMTAMRALPERLAGDAIMWVFAGCPAAEPDAYGLTLQRLGAAGASMVAIDQLDPEAAASMAADLLGAPPPAGLLGVSGGGIRPKVITELVGRRRRDVATAAPDAAGPESSAVELAVLLAEGGGSSGGGFEVRAERAVTVLRAAAAGLAATAPATAADLSGHALALARPGTPAHREITAEAVRLLWLAGRGHEATMLGHTLRAGATDPGTEAAIRLDLAAVSSQYSFAEAVRQCEIAVRLPGLADTARAPLLALLGVDLAMVGDILRAERVLTEGLGVAERVHDEQSRALCLAGQSAAAFHSGRWRTAVTLADEAFTVRDSATSGAATWGLSQWRAWLDDLAGRPDLALNRAAEGTRLAQRTGQAWLLRQWSMDRSRMLYDAGRLADARAEAEGVTAMGDELGLGNYADCAALVVTCRVALHTGDLATARRCDEEAERMRLDESPIVRRSGMWLSALVAAAHRRSPAVIGDFLAEAAAALDSGAPAMSTPSDPADEVVFVRLALRIGERDWAERAARAAERRSAANPGFPFLAAVAANARGLLTRDPGGLAAAVDGFRQHARPLPLAAALEDLAEVLGPHGIRAYGEALATYESCGAESDADRIRTALRKLAPAPAEPPTVGEQTGPPTVIEHAQPLTLTEAEVTRRAADGLTNRQIAEALTLSPHTVGTHLRHAFAKLGVSSRIDLPHPADRTGGPSVSR